VTANLLGLSAIGALAAGVIVLIADPSHSGGSAGTVIGAVCLFLGIALFGAAIVRGRWLGGMTRKSEDGARPAPDAGPYRTLAATALPPPTQGSRPAPRRAFVRQLVKVGRALTEFGVLATVGGLGFGFLVYGTH